MKKITPKAILVPTAALLVICLVATALLALTNSVTKQKTADNAVQKENLSRSLVLPEAKEFSEPEALEGGITYCTGRDGADNVGYVFTSGAKGYGGTVSVMVGMDIEGVITGIEILSHDETPGLGANSTKPEFKNRFIGKSGALTVSKTSNDGQNVQAITAATITSKAVVSAVNTALTAFETVKGGAGNG